jgi:hypothetical protein
VKSIAEDLGIKPCVERKQDRSTFRSSNFLKTKADWILWRPTSAKADNFPRHDSPALQGAGHKSRGGKVVCCYTGDGGEYHPDSHETKYLRGITWALPARVL